MKILPAIGWFAVLQRACVSSSELAMPNLKSQILRISHAAAPNDEKDFFNKIREAIERAARAARERGERIAREARERAQRAAREAREHTERVARETADRARQVRERAEIAARQAREKAELAAKIAKERAERAARQAREKAELAAKIAKEQAERIAREAREKAELAAKVSKEQAERAAREAKDNADIVAKVAKDAADKTAAVATDVSGKVASSTVLVYSKTVDPLVKKTQTNLSKCGSAVLDPTGDSALQCAKGMAEVVQDVNNLPFAVASEVANVIPWPKELAFVKSALITMNDLHKAATTAFNGMVGKCAAAALNKFDVATCAQAVVDAKDNMCSKLDEAGGESMVVEEVTASAAEGCNQINGMLDAINKCKEVGSNPLDEQLIVNWGATGNKIERVGNQLKDCGNAMGGAMTSGACYVLAMAVTRGGPGSTQMQAGCETALNFAVKAFQSTESLVGMLTTCLSVTTGKSSGEDCAAASGRAMNLVCDAKDAEEYFNPKSDVSLWDEDAFEVINFNNMVLKDRVNVQKEGFSLDFFFEDDLDVSDLKHFFEVKRSETPETENKESKTQDEPIDSNLALKDFVTAENVCTVAQGSVSALETCLAAGSLNSKEGAARCSKALAESNFEKICSDEFIAGKTNKKGRGKIAKDFCNRLRAIKSAQLDDQNVVRGASQCILAVAGVSSAETCGSVMKLASKNALSVYSQTQQIGGSKVDFDFTTSGSSLSRRLAATTRASAAVKAKASVDAAMGIMAAVEKCKNGSCGDDMKRATQKACDLLPPANDGQDSLIFAMMTKQSLATLDSKGYQEFANPICGAVRMTPEQIASAANAPVGGDSAGKEEVNSLENSAPKEKNDACAPGRFYLNKFCITCIAGMYSSNFRFPCAKCAKGKFSALESSTSCNSCIAGSLASATGLSSCSPCPAGTYAGSTGYENCFECAAGTFQAAQGSTNCPSCMSGYYSIASASACVKCAAGRLAPAGATDCIHCAAGMYTTSDGDRCFNCASGTHAPESGMPSCTSCQTGKYSSVAATMCKHCDVGTYAGSTGQVHCARCSAGTAQPATGATSCVSCDAGLYAAAAAAVTCTKCVAGKSTSSTGSNQCFTLAGLISSKLLGITTQSSTLELAVGALALLAVVGTALAGVAVAVRTLAAPAMPSVEETLPLLGSKV